MTQENPVDKRFSKNACIIRVYKNNTDITEVLLMFGTQTLWAMGLSGVICTLLPFAALIIYKRKNREAPVSAFFIGAAVFIVFVLILEQLLHTVMIPVVQNSNLLYVIYGALAAGIFEETGRLAAYKIFMRDKHDPKAAVMYGLGHGGCEAALITGVSMLSYLAMAVTVNSMGIEYVTSISSQGNAETAAVIREQIGALSGITMGSAFMTVVERVIAMTFHTAASVIMFRAAREKLVLYPVCILLHALTDVPAVMYQVGLIPLTAIYPGMCVVVGITVYLAVRSYRSMRE